MTHSVTSKTHTVIRPSSLASYPDCPRRGASNLFRKEIEAQGYDLKSSRTGIAASVGTAVHAAAAHMQMNKLETGSLGNLKDAEEIGIEALKSEVEFGVVYDSTSNNLNTAERQVIRMSRCYAIYVGPTINPVSVETRLEADVGDGFILSGQSDAIAMNPGEVTDLKTGVINRVHSAQLGAYCLLERTHGRAVKQGRTDFIKRVSLKKEQPLPVVTVYPVKDIEYMALHRINKIKSDLTEFRRRNVMSDGAPEWAFDTNPMSMLCSENFCAAYGTEFCSEWKYKEKLQ